MTRLMLVAVAVLGAFVMSGCLELDQQITVRPDGSGELKQKMLFGQQMVQMMAMQGSDDDGEQAPANAEGVAPGIAEQASDEALQAKAAEMGKGVTVKSKKLLKTDDGKQGFEVVYAFPNINDVSINTDMGPAGAGPADEEEAKEDDDDEISMKFTPAADGKPATLVVALPDDDAKDDQPEDMPEEQQQMMTQMFKDMKVRYAVVVDGKIAKTDAKYVEGNTVTLMLIDLAGLSKDAKLQGKLLDVVKAMGSKKKTEALLKRDDMAGAEKYIKIDPKKTVTIEFTK